MNSCRLIRVSALLPALISINRTMKMKLTHPRLIMRRRAMSKPSCRNVPVLFATTLLQLLCRMFRSMLYSTMKIRRSLSPTLSVPVLFRAKPLTCRKLSLIATRR